MKRKFILFTLIVLSLISCSKDENEELLGIVPNGYVQIDNGGMSVKWAKGNLISDGNGGAKIGELNDYGLYFQYGSLIGWSGGKNGDGAGKMDYFGHNALKILAKPSGFNAKSDVWNDYHGVPTLNPTNENLANGEGDPCRYYLGEPWRLPSKKEMSALFNNVSDGEWSSTNGWEAKDEYSQLKDGEGNIIMVLHYTGSRGFDGSVIDLQSTGCYYTSSIQPDVVGVEEVVRAHLLSFTINVNTTRIRNHAYPIRCVME